MPPTGLLATWMARLIVPNETPDATELRDKLVALLAAATVTPSQTWEQVLGHVDVCPVAVGKSTNWRISSFGNRSQTNLIEKAVEVIRADFPFVRSSSFINQRDRTRSKMPRSDASSEPMGSPRIRLDAAGSDRAIDDRR